MYIYISGDLRFSQYFDKNLDNLLTVVEYQSIANFIQDLQTIPGKNSKQARDKISMPKPNVLDPQNYVQLLNFFPHYIITM